MSIKKSGIMTLERRKNMAKRIDLNLPTVESRELRLGSIISWNGSTEELLKESKYEGRSEKKKGCCGNRGEDSGIRRSITKSVLTVANVKKSVRLYISGNLIIVAQQLQWQL